MSSVVVELKKEETIEDLSAKERLNAFYELTKPRITFLIVLMAAAGFVLGTPNRINFVMLTHTIIGITLLCSGVSTLNQYIERQLDGLMRRTASRPLPARKLTAMQALLFGVGLCFLAELYLAVLVNPLTAALGITVIISYVFLYTPLKTRTSFSTIIGAFPGAMPPLMGWTAASNELHIGAVVLFAIQFFWQFPHFLAIAWMYREDYARAGIKMLPVLEDDGSITARQMILYTLTLIPVSLLPTLMGFAGLIYFVGALVLGLLFLACSFRVAMTKSRQDAKRLLMASVFYLPILFVLMILNQRT
jgi:protoheme IX farnesyltransferase